MHVCVKRTVIRVCAIFAVQNPVFLHDRSHEIPLRRTLEPLFVRKKLTPLPSLAAAQIWGSTWRTPTGGSTGEFKALTDATIVFSYPALSYVSQKYEKFQFELQSLIRIIGYI